MCINWRYMYPCPNHLALLTSRAAILTPIHKTHNPPHYLYQPCFPISLDAPPFEERLHQLQFRVSGLVFGVSDFLNAHP